MRRIILLLFQNLHLVKNVEENEWHSYGVKNMICVSDTRNTTGPKPTSTGINSSILNTINNTKTSLSYHSLESSDDMLECQKFPPDTFFNGASICSKKGLQFPTPSNLNKMKTSYGQFWIGARNTYGVWRDESNEEIDPIFPVGGNFGKI